jgi:DNA-binding GntR family transcriptional regulator
VQQFPTAQHQAYIYLQDQIVSGALSGGRRLQPEMIARTLGISRMPVREAIRQLDAEGYVTIRPNRGAVVTNRTPEQVVELFEIRSVLEGLALRLAVPNVTDEVMEDLVHELHRLRRLEADSEAWVERHDEFHDLLCQVSRRPQLCAEIRRLRMAMRPYIRLYAKLHTKPEIKGHEHEYILRAMRGGDAETAERVVREHIMVNAGSIAACLPSAARPEPARRPPRRAGRPKQSKRRGKNGR